MEDARRKLCAQGHQLVSLPNGKRGCPPCRQAYLLQWRALRRTAA